MMPTARSVLPFGSCLTALALVLTFSRAAHADECVTDTDCGHGFNCIAAGGQSAGSGGASTGGAGGVAGTGSGTAGAASGGTASSSGGTGVGGSSGMAPPPEYCGDGICQDLSETVDTCPDDCTFTPAPLVCYPATCMSVADCADGYVCVEFALPGTSGGGVEPYCGDGLCNGSEDAASCVADCGFKGQCQPQAGICYADSDCPSAYYCSFVGSGPVGTGGTTGGASSGASAGTSAKPAAGSGGMATGGTAGNAAPAAGGSGAVGGAGDVVAREGTCMPLEGGTGGTTGVGGSVAVGGTAGTVASTGGSSGIGGCPGGGGCGVGGTNSGGTGQGAAGAGGSSGVGTGGTGTAGAGTGGTGTGGTGTGGTGTGGASGSSTGGKGGTTGTSHDVVTHAGCSVSDAGKSSPFGGFALVGLALGWVSTRRRARRSSPR